MTTLIRRFAGAAGTLAGAGAGRDTCSQPSDPHRNRSEVDTEDENCEEDAEALAEADDAAIQGQVAKSIW